MTAMLNPNANAMFRSEVVFPTKQDPGTTSFRAVLPPEPEEATAGDGER